MTFEVNALLLSDIPDLSIIEERTILLSIFKFLDIVLAIYRVTSIFPTLSIYSVGQDKGKTSINVSHICFNNDTTSFKIRRVFELRFFRFLRE